MAGVWVSSPYGSSLPWSGNNGLPRTNFHNITHGQRIAGAVGVKLWPALAGPPCQVSTCPHASSAHSWRAPYKVNDSISVSEGMLSAQCLELWCQCVQPVESYTITDPHLWWPGCVGSNEKRYSVCDWHVILWWWWDWRLNMPVSQPGCYVDHPWPVSHVMFRLCQPGPRTLQRIQDQDPDPGDAKHSPARPEPRIPPPGAGVSQPVSEWLQCAQCERCWPSNMWDICTRASTSDVTSESDPGTGPRSPGMPAPARRSIHTPHRQSGPDHGHCTMIRPVTPCYTQHMCRETREWSTARSSKRRLLCHLISSWGLLWQHQGWVVESSLLRCYHNYVV